MKKYISILAVLLMLSLTACSNQGTTPTGTGNTSNTQSESITMLDEGVWPVNEYTEGLLFRPVQLRGLCSIQNTRIAVSAL